MDATQEVGDASAIVPEQGEHGGLEDHRIDTLEAAMDALGDDTDPDEEPQEADSEPEEGSAEAPEESEDEADILLDDGDKVSLKELKAGYLRQRDYTHKTTETANDRKAVEARKAQLDERTTVVETAIQNFSTYLQSLIPPEPPLHLAQTNPNAYVEQMALRSNALQELGRVLELKQEVDAHRQAVTDAETRAYRASEDASLIRAMPYLADPVKRAAFDVQVKSTAKSLGFSDDEIASTADHRVLKLVHLAGLGLKAEENRRNASRRVETPKEAKPKAAVPVNVDNRKAMHRLSKTGSIKDAMNVDF